MEQKTVRSRYGLPYASRIMNSIITTWPDWLLRVNALKTRCYSNPPTNNPFILKECTQIYVVVEFARCVCSIISQLSRICLP